MGMERSPWFHLDPRLEVTDRRTGRCRACDERFEVGDLRVRFGVGDQKPWTLHPECLRPYVSERDVMEPEEDLYPLCDEIERNSRVDAATLAAYQTELVEGRSAEARQRAARLAREAVVARNARAVQRAARLRAKRDFDGAEDVLLKLFSAEDAFDADPAPWVEMARIELGRGSMSAALDAAASAARRAPDAASVVELCRELGLDPAAVDRWELPEVDLVIEVVGRESTPLDAEVRVNEQPPVPTIGGRVRVHAPSGLVRLEVRRRAHRVAIREGRLEAGAAAVRVVLEAVPVGIDGDEVVLADPVTFDVGSTTFTGPVDAVADWLSAHPEVVLRVVCEHPRPELAIARADALCAALVREGVASARLRPVGTTGNAQVARFRVATG